MSILAQWVNILSRSPSLTIKGVWLDLLFSKRHRLIYWTVGRTKLASSLFPIWKWINERKRAAGILSRPISNSLRSLKMNDEIMFSINNSIDRLQSAGIVDSRGRDPGDTKVKLLRPSRCCHDYHFVF